MAPAVSHFSDLTYSLPVFIGFGDSDSEISFHTRRCSWLCCWYNCFLSSCFCSQPSRNVRAFGGFRPLGQHFSFASSISEIKHGQILLKPKPILWSQAFEEELQPSVPVLACGRFRPSPSTFRMWGHHHLALASEVCRAKSFSLSANVVLIALASCAEFLVVFRLGFSIAPAKRLLERFARCDDPLSQSCIASCSLPLASGASRDHLAFLSLVSSCDSSLWPWAEAIVAEPLYMLEGLRCSNLFSSLNYSTTLGLGYPSEFVFL